ncbi:hypothetical protein [Sphingobacterium sp. UDSM-2020]|uniref:hypothetical protein n=1 Tax=Sphingobacterium sp. UDSM-2020 TaxID=2795738 RepID=UPI001934F547|nr:hypothetical protein [Sphingobacterium sp. UDSM-2020]QQD14743.1 hypothetical protein JAZ75_04195 [Sphingobacterium sp. UDSM-2020]
MVKIYTSVSCAFFLSIVGTQSLYAKKSLFKRPVQIGSHILRDTVKNEDSDYDVKTDTIGQMVQAMQKFKSVRDTINMRYVTPYLIYQFSRLSKAILRGFMYRSQMANQVQSKA